MVISLMYLWFYGNLGRMIGHFCNVVFLDLSVKNLGLVDIALATLLAGFYKRLRGLL